MAVLKGSCLCGAVRYEIRDTIGAISYCHCTMCQKAHGSAFGAYGRVAPESFRFTQGADMVRSYRSSETVTRTFCGTCGTNLQFLVEGRDGFGLAVGTLDDDPGVPVDEQIFTADKAPWHPLDERIPSFEAFKPMP